MTAQALTSLAILKVQWDECGHDYVENFVPFVGEALRLQSADVISIEDLQNTLKTRFSLNIPQGALKTLLARAERQGLVRRKHGVFMREFAAIPQDFPTKSEGAARQQRALLDRFITFARERYSTDLTGEQAEAALIGHLQESAVPLLASTAAGLPVPAAEAVPKMGSFLASSFVVHLDQMDPEGFQYLETVVKGYTLAAALFLPDIGKTRRHFSGLTVYLDTQLILRALGLEGARFRTASVELLDLLYRLNVNLACFSITFDELTRILGAAQHALRDPRHNANQNLFAVYEHLAATGYRASDVEMLIANLEKHLGRLHIRVREPPMHTTSLGLNERRLDELVVQSMPKQRHDAKRHDVDCITAIHRLRQGRQFLDIESCKYLFVTTNTALARAASEFLSQEHDRSSTPLCVSEHTMATLAWVKSPEVASDLSSHRFIADSYAALNPGNDLWRKYCDEIVKLQTIGGITEEDYHVLRFSMVARSALVDATLGNPDAFGTGTVLEILEAAKANARRETEDELAREREAREAAERTGTALRGDWHEQRMQQREKVSAAGSVVGKAAGIVVYGVFLGAVAILVSYGISPEALVTARTLSGAFFWSVLVAGGIVSVASVAEGWSIRAVARKVELSSASWVSKALATWFAIDL